MGGRRRCPVRSPGDENGVATPTATDIVLVVLLAAYALRGRHRGLLFVTADLLASLGGVVIALADYPEVAARLGAWTGMSAPAARLVSFFVLVLVASAVVVAILLRGVRRVPEVIRRSALNRAGGAALGRGRGRGLDGADAEDSISRKPHEQQRGILTRRAPADRPPVRRRRQRLWAPAPRGARALPPARNPRLSNGPRRHDRRENRRRPVVGGHGEDPNGAGRSLTARGGAGREARHSRSSARPTIGARWTTNRRHHDHALPRAARAPHPRAPRRNLGARASRQRRRRRPGLAAFT
ncbi:MAG: CvpA family protein [Armatimonadetes bacterium]|nr:CvpA family protein [Armatimonadota bacterium]